MQKKLYKELLDIKLLLKLLFGLKENSTIIVWKQAI